MAGLAALAACNQSGGGTSADTHLALTGAKYCTPFPQASASNSAAGLSQAPDPATAFDDCVHRWAYALAPARDPADVVAQASVDACGTALNNWTQQAQSQAPQTSSRSDQSQQNGAMAQQMRGAEARALFYVVQARAAGCAPPAANTLSAAPPPS
ncbi:MAG TPA: hypothetical protein VGG29_00800 [Caulobacteraceae bacterium]